MVWLRRLRALAYRHLNGTRIRCSGVGHTIDLGDALLHRCRIELSGAGNTLTLGPKARLWNVTIRLLGENQTCRLGSNLRLRGGQLLLEDRGGRLEIGEGTTMFDPMIVVSEGGSIRIGSDCLAAYGVDFRNSDGHAIVEASTRKRINPPADICVGNHTWLGMQSQVLKGVSVGPNAVVAARSLVNKDVAAHTLVAGVPARVVREGIDWLHERT